MKRWPLHTAYFWETAPFFRLVLPLALGIVCYDQHWLPGVTGAASSVVACGAFTLFMALAFVAKGSGWMRAAVFGLLHIALMGTGFAMSWYGDVRNSPQWFCHAAGKSSAYLARVNDAVAEKEHSWKVPVTIVSAIADGKVLPTTGNAFLYLYKDHLPVQLRKGDSVLVPGNWQPITNACNPFEFDYAQYCRQNNLFYQQTCSAKDIRLYATNDETHTPLIDRAHDWCMATLDKYLPDAKTKGLVQAMLLGDEVNLDEDLRQSYADTGIIHIIAISGGNVAIFFTAISFLLWWLKDKRHVWIKYAIALPLVWLYVVMAGAPPSAIRAAIMFSLLAGSVMLQKNSNALNTLFTASFFLLLFQPMWLFSLGFQLSFVAVLSIMLFYKPIYKWYAPANWAMRKLWPVIVASLAAEVLVAPLVIWYFHMFPLLFVVANIAGFVFMEILLLLSMAILLVSFIPAIATVLGAISIFLVTWFDKLVVWLQGLNPASFHFLMITSAELLLVYVIITGFALFLMQKNKPAAFTGLAATILLLVSFCHNEWIRLHQQRLVVYNTGKANHIEWIHADRFTVVATDTADQKRKDYAVKPAHIAWRAWQQDSATIGEVFTIAGKTAVVLNRPVSGNEHFPVDYLIINYTGKADISKLQQTFSPQAIIIGNNYSRREQEQLAKENNRSNIYAIAERGAFVLE